jgi:hypothetical protein
VGGGSLARGGRRDILMAEYLVQSESITAVADAIREKGGTTEPLSFPAGMAEAVRDIPSGGTDISLGLTAATVGQTIKVKAVDADGKPTAWEAVDMAGGETEVIALSEDVNAVTFDLKGCDSFAIVLDAPPVDTEMTYVFPTFNSIVGTFITLNFAYKANRRISVLQINKIVDELWFFSFKPGNAVTLKDATLSKVGDISVLNNTIPMDITSMGLNAYTGQRFPKGTKIYVVRGKTVV